MYRSVHKYSTLFLKHGGQISEEKDKEDKADLKICLWC